MKVIIHEEIIKSTKKSNCNDNDNTIEKQVFVTLLL